jgi:hypothetical protein
VSESYTCSNCNGFFTKTRSDAEARAEQHEKFPQARDEDCELVCDACFKIIACEDDKLHVTFIDGKPHMWMLVDGRPTWRECYIFEVSLPWGTILVRPPEPILAENEQLVYLDGKQMPIIVSSVQMQRTVPKLTKT